MNIRDIKDILLFVLIVVLGVTSLLIYFDKGKYISIHNANNTVIQSVLEKNIKYCGVGYFSSLFDIKDHLTNTESKQAIMINQYGWLPIVGKGWTVSPTKTFNRDWYKPIIIQDELSLNFLHSLKDSEPVYYDNINDIKHVPLIKELLNRSDITPKTASVVIVKKNNNIIYANILSNTNLKNKKCEKEKGYKILQETSHFIKKILW
jgi:hypothetical protein